MKKFLFVFMVLLAVGCNSDSNDDTHNDPPGDTTDDGVDPTDDGQGQAGTDLIRYTHTTFNQFPEPEDIIFDFNQNGSIDRFKFEFNNGSSTGYDQYVYDQEERLTKIDHYSDSGDFEVIRVAYNYDAQGRLLSMIDYASQGVDNPRTTNFSWDGNTVNFEQEVTGKTGYVIFDSSNRILETNHNSGPEQFTRSELTYDSNGLLVEVNNYVNDQLSYTVTLEYDDQTNPLYPAYSSNPLVYLSQGIYDFDFTGTIKPYSMHNVIRELIPGIENRDDQTTYQYNSEGYPTMGTTQRNGTLRAEHKFDY